MIRTHCAREMELSIDMGCGNHKKGTIGLDIKTDSEADIIGDAHNTPFRDKIFDKTICTEVLEHLPSPLKAIKELYRITKNIIIITIPNIHNIWGWYRWLREGRLSGSPEHIYAWTQREFRNILREAKIFECQFSYTTWPHYHKLSPFKDTLPRIFNKSLVIKAEVSK